MGAYLLVNMSDTMFTLWLVLSVICLVVLFLTALFTIIIVLSRKAIPTVSRASPLRARRSSASTKVSRLKADLKNGRGFV